MISESRATGKYARTLGQLLNAPKMAKPKRKIINDAIIEGIEILADTIKAQNKAEREYLVTVTTSNAQHQAEHHRATYRGTGRANKWEAKALSIFHGDGWADKVDEEVAEYTFREWESSYAKAYLFVLKSDEKRAASLERLKEKIEVEDRELGVEVAE